MPGDEEVALFLLPLDVPAARLDALRATFSPREQARFESFAHEEHRFRWGAARGLLREILGRALSVPPGEVAFSHGEHGKPRLPGAELRFNLSHSAGLGLLALSRSREVGVDLELPRGRRTDDLARRFFAPGEQARLFALDEAARFEAFFRLWCCKEAFLKVTGEGLSRSLRSYEIELSAGSARMLWAKGIPDAAERYGVHPLETGNPVRAALVVEGRDLLLRTHRWP